jgi:hypothetical protein
MKPDPQASSSLRELTPGELIHRLTHHRSSTDLARPGAITLLDLADLRDWLETRDDRLLRLAGRVIDRFLWAVAVDWIESERKMKA